MLNLLKKKFVEMLATIFAAVLHQDKVVDAMLRRERIRRALRENFTENMEYFLQSPEGHKLFWTKANVRPSTRDTQRIPTEAIPWQ